MVNTCLSLPRCETHADTRSTCHGSDGCRTCESVPYSERGLARLQCGTQRNVHWHISRLHSAGMSQVLVSDEGKTEVLTYGRKSAEQRNGSRRHPIVYKAHSFISCISHTLYREASSIIRMSECFVARKDMSEEEKKYFLHASELEYLMNK